MKDAKFSDLTGKTLVAVRGAVGDGDMLFTCSDGSVYRMYHDQDCCEGVSVEDVCGEFSDMLDTPILDAREETNSTENPPGVKKDYQDSFTWTFYILRTIKGSVTIRWYGESNGYYSESVSFEQVEP
jgi:hypothetical protein